MTTLIELATITGWDLESKKHVLPVVTDLLPFLPERHLNILDVGSNTGKFIELLMEHATVNDAILVEPIAELLAYSKTKFPHFKFENRLIHKDTRPAVVYTPHGNSNLGLSRILECHHGTGAEFLREMETISLATLLTELHPTFKPDIIKIDAEGFDVPIVEGLVDYVRANPEHLPIIIYECNGNTDVTCILDLYLELGYDRYCRLPETLSRDEFLIPKNIVLARD